MPKKDPIQLDRRFLELSETDAEHPTDHELALTASMKARSWEQILEHRCVVILGEAGTGKTTEIEQRSGILSANGKAAFSLTVEDLVTQGVEGSLTSKMQRRLAEWRATSERGYFFLDAVDEAGAAPHVEDEIRINNMVDRFGFDDCEKLFNTIRFLNGDLSLRVAEEYSSSRIGNH